MRKKCFKCGRVKDINQFYTHPQMRDGYLNKCKECAKKDVTDRYRNPRSRKKIKAYERARNQTEHRKQCKIEYQKKSRESSPGKHRCRAIVYDAIRDGRLIKRPCRVCGSRRSEAHHPDYRSPLRVEWLCFKHHRELAHGQKTTQQNQT